MLKSHCPSILLQFFSKIAFPFSRLILPSLSSLSDILLSPSYTPILPNFSNLKALPHTTLTKCKSSLLQIQKSYFNLYPPLPCCFLLEIRTLLFICKRSNPWLVLRGPNLPSGVSCSFGPFLMTTFHLCLPDYASSIFILGLFSLAQKCWCSSGSVLVMPLPLSMFVL